jgi:hypothetical protein
VEAESCDGAGDGGRWCENVPSRVAEAAPGDADWPESSTAGAGRPVPLACVSRVAEYEESAAICFCMSASIAKGAPGGGVPSLAVPALLSGGVYMVVC